MKDFKQYLKIVQESYYDAEHSDDVQAELDIEYLKDSTHNFPDSLKRGFNHEQFKKLILDEKKVNEIMEYLDNKIEFLEQYDERILNALSYILTDFIQPARIKYMKEKLKQSQLESYEKLNKELENYRDQIDERLQEVLNSKQYKERQEQETMDLEKGWRKDASKVFRKNWTY